MAKIEHYHTRFEFGRFYHVYNRCVDRQPLFRSDSNCRFFIRRYREYMWPVVDTLAYCLMGNHFHLLIKVRDEEYYRMLAEGGDELVCVGPQGIIRHPLTDAGPEEQVAGSGGHVRRRAGARTPALTTFKKLSKLGLEQETGTNSHTPFPSAHDIIYPQFRRFFQSYALAFNKQHQRCGTLFQTPFKRALLPGENDIRNAIRYIHMNPVNHNACFSPAEYPWSSFSHISNQSSRWLDLHSVSMVFGNIKNFRDLHPEHFFSTEPSFQPAISGFPDY